MRAMLENVIASLPAHRHAALVDERHRLDRMLESFTRFRRISPSPAFRTRRVRPGHRKGCAKNEQTVMSLGAIPEQLLTVVAAITVFTVMFDLGLENRAARISLGLEPSRTDCQSAVFGVDRSARRYLDADIDRPAHEVYAGHASIAPAYVAKQVFIALLCRLRRV